MVLTFEWVSCSSVVGFCLALRGQHGCKLRTFITSRFLFFFFRSLSPSFLLRLLLLLLVVVSGVALLVLFDLIFFISFAGLSAENLFSLPHLLSSAKSQLN